MKDSINMGIGFVTGRPNVCNIINSYYKNMLEQVSRFHKKVNLTIFILFDLSYQYTKRTDFYNIIPEVYRENIKVRYITPEILEREKKVLQEKCNLSKEEVEMFIGYGHARPRNTLLYYALKSKIDYLLFWDDDEYPLACKKDEETGKISWVKQDNILEHLKRIDKADVTIGHHCGYISPIPYIDYGNEIEEKELKDFIEAISNDIITWESIREKFEKDNGVTFAKEEYASGEAEYEIQWNKGGKWIAGSTLCLNLNHIDKIPAFFNPPEARGEDTFFATKLKDSKVIRVPVYHFHDGFLKYKQIMKGNYPKTLRLIGSQESEIEMRFLKAARGWIKYKPLFMYITEPETYDEKAADIQKRLEASVPKMNDIFVNSNFEVVLEDFEKYNSNVKKDYQDYEKVNEIWDKIKESVKNSKNVDNQNNKKI